MNHENLGQLTSTLRDAFSFTPKVMYILNSVEHYKEICDWLIFVCFTTSGKDNICTINDSYDTLQNTNLENLFDTFCVRRVTHSIKIK